MTNFEKYKETLAEIGVRFAVLKNGTPVPCEGIGCYECVLFGTPSRCNSEKVKWLLEDDGTPSDQMTNEEVWQMAKKILSYDSRAIKDIFGTTTGSIGVFDEYTASDAKAALDEYEKEQQIEVGDIIYCKEFSRRAVVTRIANKFFEVLYEDGMAARVSKGYWGKTGEHVDMQAILDAVAPSDEG